MIKENNNTNKIQYLWQLLGLIWKNKLICSLISVLILSGILYFNFAQHILAEDWLLSLFFSALQIIVTYFVVDRILQKNRETREDILKQEKYAKYALKEQQLILGELKGFISGFFVLSDDMLYGTEEEKFSKAKKILESEEVNTEIFIALSRKYLEEESKNEIYPLIDHLIEFSRKINPLINNHLILYKDCMSKTSEDFFHEISNIILSDKLMGSLSNNKNLLKYKFSSSIIPEIDNEFEESIYQKSSLSLKNSLLKIVEEIEKIENTNDTF
ncbi:hypothetical protein HCJ71_02105 [Listeria sp. FSL L7-0478]|uniref:hypothetical protein n=1 Tax=Listeria cossartiae TaxID=2838249 RepID=UPI001627319A|nr:hypothetical protein [Listeria cossartiae]MBC1986073.1 hypothetical protein [Listeria cossartiae subsp. cossartiae]